ARFAVGSARRLPVAPGGFDACRAERLLLHLDDPPAALAEMRRALKPGGRLVVFDLDWEGVAIDHPDRALTRRLLQLICDRHRHPWLGRQLPRLLRDAGFGQVGAVPHAIVADFPFFQRICKDTLARAAALGVADWGALREWEAYLAAEARAGRFFAVFSGFAAYGRSEG
ncbi:MAG TPA: methyltransferase domain-containing protein, partial [Herpetosiphonaceae bacterium]